LSSLKEKLKRFAIIPKLLEFGVDRLFIAIMIAKTLKEHSNGLPGPMLWHHVNMRFDTDISYKRVRNIVLFLRRLGCVKKVKTGGHRHHVYVLTDEGKKELEKWVKMLNEGVELISR